MIICANCALDKHRTHFLEKFYSSKYNEILNTKNSNWRQRLNNLIQRSTAGYQKLFFEQTPQLPSTSTTSISLKQPYFIQHKGISPGYVNVEKSELNMSAGITYTSVY